MAQSMPPLPVGQITVTLAIGPFGVLKQYCYRPPTARTNSAPTAERAAFLDFVLSLLLAWALRLIWADTWHTQDGNTHILALQGAAYVCNTRKAE